MRKARHKIFTESNVSKLPINARKQYQVWDRGIGRGAGECARGLSILVSPSGVRSFRSTFYFIGSPKAHSRHLGRVGEMTLEEARELCREDRGKARKGIDPRTDDAIKSDSFKACVDDYIKRVQIGEKHAIKATEAHSTLLRDTTDWHVLPISTIGAKEIQRVLELVRDGDPQRDLKPRPYLSNLLHARLKTFFAWCAKPTIGKLKTSPMLGIDRPYGDERARDLPWFKGEAANVVIKQLWAAADKLGGVEGRYLKMLVLTGKRKSALAAMKWEEIEEVKDGWFWNAPSGNKTKRLHSIPLSVLAMRILHPRQTSGAVFPGRRGDHIDVSGRLTVSAIAAGVREDFFLHGCRHIAETKMAELKVQAHIRDLLLDHVPKRGTGEDYDHYEYEDELRAAVEKWADYVEQLVTPKGITRLKG